VDARDQRGHDGRQFAAAKNTEGVGEIRRIEDRWQVTLPPGRCGACPFLQVIALPHFGRTVTLEPLSRRRPLFVDWSRRVEGDGVALSAVRSPPARVTQPSTSSRSRRLSAASVYFFRRRRVFFAVFFDAALAFLLFFAMLPS